MISESRFLIYFCAAKGSAVVYAGFGEITHHYSSHCYGYPVSDGDSILDSRPESDEAVSSYGDTSTDHGSRTNKGVVADNTVVLNNSSGIYNNILSECGAIDDGTVEHRTPLCDMAVGSDDGCRCY